ncbi:MAG: acyltransferase family protein, partial [Promethearchaeota archaeon]
FNAANSFKKNDVPLSSFKSYLQYCLRKIKRYIIPFALLYIFSTIFGLFRYGNFESLLQNQFDGHWGRALLWYFILPFYGPGNWFIPILFQSVIVLPFLYWGYKKSPKKFLALSVLWEIGMQYFIFTYYGHWCFN